MADPRDLPLFAFGDALRRARGRRRMLRRRGFALGLGIAALGLTIVAPPRPRLVWNASASAPIGLYRIDPAATPALGDWVFARLPEPARALAAARHYLPRNVPALKQVAAVAGMRVCGVGAVLAIDGRPVARRRAVDARGRPLPRFEGCRTLRAGELLLLNRTRADSFDGRYFGVSQPADPIGIAHPLWTRDAAEPGP